MSSPSLRGRGLKFLSSKKWHISPESPSLRGRGLKSRYHNENIRKPWVALFARAWIEIMTGFIKTFPKKVALFARAWIEISTPFHLVFVFMSPSLRGRGLKF